MPSLAALALLVLWNFPEAAGQVWRSGTIIILDFETDRLLVAADSRESLSDSKNYNDDACKIVPLGDYGFFSATGRTELERNDGTVVFDATEIAKHAVKRAPSHQIREAASWWGNDIKRILENMRNTPGFALPPPGEFATGIFATSAAGPKEANEIQADEAKVLLLPGQAGKSPPRFRVEVTPLNARAERPYLLFFGSSEGTEGVKEFLNRTSKRALLASERIRQETESGRAEDLSARILEASIQFASDVAIHKNEIGGPVDILELPKGGKIKWTKVKSRCH
jgi:hypothetical protein